MTAPAPSRRSPRRRMLVPTEHGGWGLTLEPGVLGLLVVPSWAGMCLVFAAVLGFVARNPVRIALLDLRQRRRLPRTRLAARIAAAELSFLAALVLAAVVLAEAPFWAPAVVAVPLLAVELWFDSRSQSRRLAPELAGATAVAAVGAMVVLAGGGDSRLAAGIWLLLAARSLTSLPWVRAQIQRLRGRGVDQAPVVAGDVAAMGAAGVAVAIERGLALGAAAVMVLLAVQRLAGRGRPAPAKVLGIGQTIAGLLVVLLAALGVHLA